MNSTWDPLESKKCASQKKKRRNVDAWTQTQYPNGYLEGQVINIGCTTTKLTIYLPFYQLNKKRKSMLFFNDYKKKKIIFSPH